MRQILSGIFFYYLHHKFPLDPAAYSHPTVDDPMDSAKATLADAAVKTVDAVTSKPDETQLDPPKDTPFTKAELAKYNGADPSTPIYVAIKGKIYDGAASSLSVSVFRTPLSVPPPRSPAAYSTLPNPFLARSLGEAGHVRTWVWLQRLHWQGRIKVSSPSPLPSLTLDAETDCSFSVSSRRRTELSASLRSKQRTQSPITLRLRTRRRRCWTIGKSTLQRCVVLLRFLPVR